MTGTGRPENRAGVKRELGQILADQRHHPGIVRARADLAEPHVVVLDEELDPEDARAAEFTGHEFGDPLALGQRRFGHGLRLPGLLVVASFLPMADGCAEGHSASGGAP